MKMHQSKPKVQESSQWSSNSSAVRWNNSSACTDSIATIIRDSVFIMVDEDESETPYVEPHFG